MTITEHRHTIMNVARWGHTDEIGGFSEYHVLMETYENEMRFDYSF